MHRVVRASLWAGALLCCLAALHLTRNAKWPAEHDLYKEAERATGRIKPYLLTDSVLNIRVARLPEDFYNYLRYCLIPQRARLSPRVPFGKELLVAPRRKVDSTLMSLRAPGRTSAVLMHYEDATTGYYLIQY